jgi:hypothetical protein
MALQQVISDEYGNTDVSHIVFECIYCYLADIVYLVWLLKKIFLWGLCRGIVIVSVLGRFSNL